VDSENAPIGTPGECIVRLHCDQCDCDVVPVDGATAIWGRGYWWCAKHCQFFYADGVPVVDFPSEGKLIPSTIMTPCE